jgi:hypothetical protein
MTSPNTGVEQGGYASEMSTDYDISVVLDEIARTLGDRWADAWIEHTPVRTAFVGVVDPRPEDVLLVHRRLAKIDWNGSVVAARYSEAELNRLQDRVGVVLESPIAQGKWSSLERDPVKNKLHVLLNTEDHALVAALLDAVPSDAIVISIRPGWRWSAYPAPREDQRTSGDIRTRWHGPLRLHPMGNLTRCPAG